MKKKFDIRSGRKSYMIVVSSIKNFRGVWRWPELPITFSNNALDYLVDRLTLNSSARKDYMT